MTRVLIILFIAVAATLVPPAGRATGGRYAFVGGTPREQAEVTRALHASSFDFAWGVVQHEYAHQVDFFLLNEPARELLMRELGARTWCSDTAVPHDRLGCERFASALAWAYWPSPENVMRVAPTRGFSPVRFRGLVNKILRTEGAR